MDFYARRDSRNADFEGYRPYERFFDCVAARPQNGRGKCAATSFRMTPHEGGKAGVWAGKMLRRDGGTEEGFAEKRRRQNTRFVCVAERTGKRSEEIALGHFAQSDTA
jgi:hypothetical protein